MKSIIGKSLNLVTRLIMLINLKSQQICCLGWQKHNCSEFQIPVCLLGTEIGTQLNQMLNLCNYFCISKQWNVESGTSFMVETEMGQMCLVGILQNIQALHSTPPHPHPSLL